LLLPFPFPSFPFSLSLHLLAVGLLGSTPAAGQCVGGVCLPSAEPHPAVVRVVNDLPSARCYGSGTLVEKSGEHALILTCAHLFREKTGDVRVVFADGTTLTAEVLAVDPLWDLAALRIARPPAEPVAIAQQFARPGEAVSSCGFGPDGRYARNRGRALGYVRTAHGATFETLELTGSARDGDSGGPVFNQRGELVAVLWGTDGRTVGGTYCGRVRKFLATLLGRPAPPSEPPLVPVRPPNANEQDRSLSQRLEKIEAALAAVAALGDRVERAESAVGKDNLRAVIREVALGIAADRGPGLVESLLPKLLAALGWTGPPSIAAIVAIRLASRLLRRRVRKRLASSGSATSPPRPALNDDYARQLADVYALCGHSTTADATLGREYDAELRGAEQSSDATLARWARQLRTRVARRFYRIHGETPSPAEPVT